MRITQTEKSKIYDIAKAYSDNISRRHFGCRVDSFVLSDVRNTISSGVKDISFEMPLDAPTFLLSQTKDYLRKDYSITVIPKKLNTIGKPNDKVERLAGSDRSHHGIY